jgi:hypothetical protein
MRRHTRHEPFIDFEVQPLDVTIKTPEEARALMEQLIHDCPECRAARARGEEPMIFEGPLPTPRPEELRRARGLFARRPRWRAMKRAGRR